MTKQHNSTIKAAPQGSLPSDASSQCIALQCTVCDQDFKPNCTFKSHMKKHHHRASPPSEAFSQCNPIYTMQCHTQCYTQCNTLHTGILYIWDILWFQSNHSCTPFLALNNALCVIKMLSQAIPLRVTWKKTASQHNTTQQSTPRIVRCSLCVINISCQFIQSDT